MTIGFDLDSTPCVFLGSWLKFVILFLRFHLLLNFAETGVLFLLVQSLMDILDSDFRNMNLGIERTIILRSQLRTA